MQIIDPHDGRLVGILGILDQQPGKKYKLTDFNQPTGIAVSKDRVIVSDFGNKRIKVSHFGTFFDYITVWLAVAGIMKVNNAAASTANSLISGTSKYVVQYSLPYLQSQILTFWHRNYFNFSTFCT